MGAKTGQKAAHRPDALERARLVTAYAALRNDVTATLIADGGTLPSKSRPGTVAAAGAVGAAGAVLAARSQ